MGPGQILPLLFVYTKRYKTLASGSYQYCRASGKKGLTPMIPWPQDLKHGKQGTSYSASCSAVPSKKDSLSCRSSLSTSYILQSAMVSAIAIGFTSHCCIFYIWVVTTKSTVLHYMVCSFAFFRCPYRSPKWSQKWSQKVSSLVTRYILWAWDSVAV